MTPQSEAEFREAVKQGRELESSEDAGFSQPTGRLEEQVPGIKFLASLLKATIFTDLFVYHADIRFVHFSRQERVDALIRLHPTYYTVCRNADLITRAVLVTVTVALTVTAAVGTMFRLFFA